MKNKVSVGRHIAALLALLSGLLCTASVPTPRVAHTAISLKEDGFHVNDGQPDRAYATERDLAEALDAHGKAVTFRLLRAIRTQVLTALKFCYNPSLPLH